MISFGIFTDEEIFDFFDDIKSSSLSLFDSLEFEDNFERAGLKKTQ